MEAATDREGFLWMRLVKVEWSAEWRGFVTDPREYLSQLVNFKDELPEGAKEYASHPGHYDYDSPYCVKDLKLIEISLDRDSNSWRLTFDPNPWKHERGLRIKYIEASDINVQLDLQQRGSIGDEATLMLDEVLPQGRGCSHELIFTSGRIMVSCNDILAEWA